MIAEFRTAASAIMSRMRWANMAGIQFGGLRDTYQIFGYKRTLGYWDYRDRYARDGVAKAVVDTYPVATWRGGVELFEDEDPQVDTAFEQAFKDIDARLGFWQTCQQVDILAGLSTFAVLLIGVSGGSNLMEELPKGQRLLFLKPFSGGGGEDLKHREMSQALDASARIAQYDVDPQSERFGEPASYYIRSQTPGSTFLNFEVHWSRVIHVAEGCLEDNVFGIPTLENVFNLFDDLAKITGGGAEAFFLRANQGLHLDVDKDMGMPGQVSTGLSPDAREALKDKAEELQHQLQRVLVTRGVTATQLGSDVANFGPSGDFILKLIAGATRIPMRILTGSEMGTLASEQDAANFDSRVQDRRTGYAGPKIVRRTIDRLIAYGYLPTPAKYEVGWPVEENMDEVGKAGYAVQLASVNQTYGSTVFLDDEIRDMAFDLEPLTAAQKKAAQPEPPAEVPEPEPELKDAELLRVLEAAIDADNEEVIASIIGVTHRAAGDVAGHEFHGNQWKDSGTIEQVGDYPPTFEHKLDGGWSVGWSEQDGVKGAYKAHPTGDKRNVKYFKSKQAAYSFASKRPYRIEGLQAGPRKHATTQITLDAATTESILALGRSIPDADIYEPEGRETEPHVTVKYGLIDPSREKLQGVLAYRGPVSLTLGKTAVFETPDYDVVYVGVNSPSLMDLHKAIGLMECAPSDHEYLPHATVAYVKSGLGGKYIEDTSLADMTIDTSVITLVMADGERSEVRLA
jgi:2'-5' RNA ligase